MRAVDSKPAAPARESCACPHPTSTVRVSKKCRLGARQAELPQAGAQTDEHDACTRRAMCRESLRAMIDRSTSGNDREQDLRGTDVRGRFLAPNMLFAGLQRQPIGGDSAGIDRHADQAARQGALVFGSAGNECRMRPPIPHGQPETLRRTDCDIGAEFAWDGQERQRQRVCCHDRYCTGRMQLRHGLPVIADVAGAPGILNNSSEHPAMIEISGGISND